MGFKIDYKNSMDTSYLNEFYMDENSSYNTLYNLIENNKREFLRGRYKIAYGYVTSNTKLSFRHCFLIDVLSKKIIDPSCMNYIDCEYDSEKYKYEVFTEFDSLNEYMLAVNFSSYIVKEIDKTLQRLLQTEENEYKNFMRKEEFKELDRVIIAS
ncbi:MAG: hypothetical protein ACRCWG_05550 [Sarcina sp.]